MWCRGLPAPCRLRISRASKVGQVGAASWRTHSCAPQPTSLPGRRCKGHRRVGRLTKQLFAGGQEFGDSVLHTAVLGLLEPLPSGQSV